MTEIPHRARTKEKGGDKKNASRTYKNEENATSSADKGETREGTHYHRGSGQISTTKQQHISPRISINARAVGSEGCRFL